MEWLTLKKFSEISGISEDAIRANLKKGVWQKDKHWIKAPNGRLFCNPKEVEQWLLGKGA